MFFASGQCFLMVLMCSWVFWPRNDTERLWNHLKRQVLEPKQAVTVKKKTKKVCCGSNTCFLRWFHNRSVSFLGQETQEHIKTIKKRCLEVKNDIFSYKCILKKVCFPYVFLRFPHFGSKTDFLIKLLNDSAWFCMEKLKKHSFETPKNRKYTKQLK